MASDTPEFPSKCPTCPGLLNRNAFLESLEGSEDCQTTIRALQSANDCPNGGCNLILDAITKFCPRLSPDQYVVSCGQGTVVLEVSNDTDSSSSTRLQLFFTKGDQHPTWPGITHGACHEDLTSPESLDFVQTQLSHCLEHHTACNTQSTSMSYMPTRVLDLGFGNDGALDLPVKLIESTKVTGDRRYACLSHTQDPNETISTTTNSPYAPHNTRTALSFLSQAFQQAIPILRRLSIRYLWTPSLCTITDSPSSLDLESSHIAKIYTNAHFTLALHHFPPPTSPKSHAISPPSLSPPIFVRKFPSHISDPDSMSFPLLRQASFYQPRLLSPRVVYFSSDELSFECSELVSCQCGHRALVDRSLSFLQVDAWEGPKCGHAKVLGLLGCGRVDDGDVRGRWRGMVREYTGLDFDCGFGFDERGLGRLRGIGGLAEQISTLVLTEEDKYVYGLWTNSSVVDLAWKVSSTSTHTDGASNFRTEWKPRHPASSNVPSWSWASVHGKIEYPRDVPDDDEEDGTTAVFMEMEIRDEMGQGQSTSTYCIVTGKVLSGRLRLVCSPSLEEPSPLEELEILREDLEPTNEPAWLPLPSHTFHPDFDLTSISLSSSPDGWFDVTFIRLWGDVLESTCLLLWRYGNGGAGSERKRKTDQGYAIYQRIGVVEFDGYWSGSGDGDGGPISGIRWDKAREITVALE